MVIDAGSAALASGIRPAEPPGEWRRNWTVLLPSLAGITLSGIHGFSLGVMIVPLEQEFGWSRTAISVGPMIISAIALVGAPLAGLGIDRFGPRRIAILGVALFCCALAFVSTTQADVRSWWLHWAILGTAYMLIMPTVWATAINSLFTVNRGKALAFALCGTGVAAAVVPILTQTLITGYGWRGAYIGLALIGGGIVMPLVLLFFRGATDRPAANAAEVASNGVETRPSLPGLAVPHGFIAPSFVKLSIAVVLFGVSSIALPIIAVPVLRSQGFDAASAAAIAGLIGIGSICGRLAGGFLLDRFDAKKVAASAALFPALSVLLFTMFPGSTLPVSAGALLLGLSAGTEVDACAYLAARHFGMRNFGTLFGAINGFVMFGAGIAPIAANYVYDVMGTYQQVLFGVVPLSAAAAVLFLALGRYPDWSAQARLDEAQG